jgi:osmotically-inducible protein OsmY
MRTDAQIEKEVKEELAWESRVNGAYIEVQVQQGVVTLSGSIDSLSRKHDSEVAAIRVHGVTDVINNLEVKIPEATKRNDAEIERAILNAIIWNSSIDESKIRVKVKNGWVTLEGEVPWEYQKSRAKNLAADKHGVTGITNLIKVVPNSPPQDAKERIKAALKRNHYIDSTKVNVKIAGNKVILSGEVRNIEEKNAVEYAAWSAPGITDVDNRLVVNLTEIFT